MDYLTGALKRAAAVTGADLTDRWEKGVIMLCTLAPRLRWARQHHTAHAVQPTASEEPCIEASWHVPLSSPHLNACNLN